MAYTNRDVVRIQLKLGQLRRSKCRGASKFRHDEGAIEVSTQSRDYVVIVMVQVVCYIANMTGALPENTDAC